MPTSPSETATPTAGEATLLRRFGGFVVDWVLSALVTFLLLPYDLAQPGSSPTCCSASPRARGRCSASSSCSTSCSCRSPARRSGTG
ncbi:hypothetical protein G7075_05070 [Phycicoccus sp. HDW14]|uniref:hypothetical protein n=1 Tax=Phycicoccus sp. HDW14 TaxID=2714941 RepID=UPI00140D6EB7|nr:hypothetical protein [Phycicoccus sp. HDW14]QIM20671.1 hypothetical protein G7075_05070 [Phycicoccus sp. HDW14]